MKQELQFQDVFGEPKEARVVELNVSSVPKDKDTFKALYDKLYLPVYYFARTFVNEEDAEDITSISFLKLWRSNVDYSIEPKVRTWLNVCARNACLDLLRRRKKDSTKMANLVYYLNTQLEGDNESQIREELIKRLYIEIEKLPRQCKRVFKMAYLESRSSRQIADLLGISENTVTCHRVRSLKLLRIAFQDFSWILLMVLNILPHFSGL